MRRTALLFAFVLPLFCGCPKADTDSVNQSPEDLDISQVSMPEVPETRLTLIGGESGDELIGWKSRFDGDPEPVERTLADGGLELDSAEPIWTFVPFPAARLTILGIESPGDERATLFLRSAGGEQISTRLPASGAAVVDWTGEEDAVRSLAESSPEISDVTAFADVSLPVWIGLAGKGVRVGEAVLDLVDLPEILPKLSDDDTTDLAGWRSVPRHPVVVEPPIEFPGVALTAQGLGLLESEAEFGDFVLTGTMLLQPNGSAEDEPNGGLFFRALPGTADAPANGYEFQLSHAVEDGDPARPADGGTGAIFRRANARRVTTSSDAYFRIALVAHGPAMMTWVDGQPQVAVVDRRPIDAGGNPRKGTVLSPGRLSLQVHDAGSRLEVLGLRAASLAPPEKP